MAASTRPSSAGLPNVATRWFLKGSEMLVSTTATPEPTSTTRPFPACGRQCTGAGRRRPLLRPGSAGPQPERPVATGRRVRTGGRLPGVHHLGGGRLAAGQAGLRHSRSRRGVREGEDAAEHLPGPAAEGPPGSHRQTLPASLLAGFPPRQWPGEPASRVGRLWCTRPSSSSSACLRRQESGTTWAEPATGGGWGMPFQAVMTFLAMNTKRIADWEWADLALPTG